MRCDWCSFALPRVLMLLLASLCSGSGFPAEPAPIVQDEIQHLLTYLEKSDCEFFRNGKWYGASEAKNHVTSRVDSDTVTSVGSRADMYSNNAMGAKAVRVVVRRRAKFSR